jgi:hypothetical protein
MAFAGLRGTGKFGADERPLDFREMILWARPNGSAPLTALLSKMKSEKTDFATFNWWVEKLNAVRVLSSGLHNTTATTITLVSGGLDLVPGDILQVEKSESTTYDNELVEVTSVTNDTSINVNRGVAGSTAASFTGAYLTRVGSAFQEGTSSPSISQRNPTKITNYCQLFKTSVGITGTAMAEQGHRTGDPWKNDKIRKMFDHAASMEFAFLFGKPYEDTSGAHPKRFTGGLRYFITTNVTIFTTTPTEDTFLSAVYKVFDYNVSDAGDERIAFCGNGFLNSLNKLAKNSASSRVIFDGVVELYGMRLTKWILPQGTILFKTHPLLNLHGRYSNSAFIIDPSSLRYRYLRDTRFKDNVQAPDEDSRKGYWLTECGLEVQHEYTCAYIGNFVV